MGLSTAIKSAVSAAFTAIDDLTTVVTYNAPGATSYNPTTGQNEASVTTVNVKAVFVTEPSRVDNMQRIALNTPQLLIKTADFTTELSVNGTFTVNGVRYDVVSWRTDPANALYTIDLARSV